MKNCLIVCEFNPFHYGHEYLIQSVKNMGYNVICLMSGNFTQRGEPAIISKYQRAKSAILGGADLVLEYVFPYCSTNSEIFTSNAIKIAKGLNVFDAIAFGSESNDVDEIIKIASNMLNKDFINKINEKKPKGKRYSEILRETYNYHFGKTELLSNSNDILNIGYVKTIIDQDIDIDIIPIKRKGDNYNDENLDDFSSAKSLRKLIVNNDLFNLEKTTPIYSYNCILEAINNGEVVNYDKLVSLYEYYYRFFRTEKKYNVFEQNIEIINRAKRVSSCFKNDNSYYFNEISNKIFSSSKIQRTLLHDIVDSKLIGDDYFTQVLATNKDGREVLSKIKKNSSIDVLTKPADYKKMKSNSQIRYELNLKAENLYAMLMKNKRGIDFMIKQKPFIDK